MSKFLLIFTLAMIFAHTFVGMSLRQLFQPGAAGRTALAVLFVALLLLCLFGFRLIHELPPSLAHGVAWLFYTWLGILWFMLVTLTVADAVILLSRMVPLASWHDPGKRAMFKAVTGVLALGTAAGLATVAALNGRAFPAVKPVDVGLKRLPPSLDGLRIVQLTDLHIDGSRGRDWLREVVERAQALTPDLIVITGDLVDGFVNALSVEVAPLAELSAPLGVYFVTGNHDYFSGADEWCRHVASLGIRILRNERVSISRGAPGESLDLVGIEDYSSRTIPHGGPDLTKALRGRDESVPAVLLAHQPVAVLEAAEHGIDLQLSGHTHGGQIWPFGFLVHLAQPYIRGLHRVEGGDTQIYVSCGTGSWGPPMRLAAPEEITHITLRRA